MSSQNDDDDGFSGYIETTVDPGKSIVILTVIVCVALYVVLACIVSFGHRYQWSKQHGHAADQSTAEEPEETELPGNNNEASLPIASAALQATSGASRVSPAHDDDDDDDDDDDLSFTSSARSGRSSDVAISNMKYFVLDGAAPPPHGGPTLMRQRARVERRAQQLEHHQEITTDSEDVVAVQSVVMGKMDDDADEEMSFQDAVDAQHRGSTIYQDAVDTSPPWSREDPWWKRSALVRSFDGLLIIVEWDYETKRIFKLALPFVLQAVLGADCETARMAIIGQFLGTRALAAYVVVHVPLGITSDFLGGFEESLTTLCSQAVGAKNYKLAGQYVQLSMVLFNALNIPVIVFWIFFVDDFIRFSGFDVETAAMGRSYAIVYMFTDVVGSLNGSIHGLLDVIGKETYSTIFVAIEEIVTTLALLAAAFLAPNISLQAVGFIYLAVDAVSLVVNVFVMLWNGWFDRFLEGIIGSCALRNRQAIRSMFKISIPLSFGYLLLYTQWEVLTIFANFLGPAEVTAWAIMGSIWDLLEHTTGAISDAAEVRCAYLLGAGKPQSAKMSSYKSIFLAMVSACLATSLLYILGEDIPTWITRDDTLQSMLAEIVPIIGIGNIALTMGTVAWTLVGSQGRYGLATTVGFAGSWFVAVPLAAIFSVALNINLQGQTAATVIGYMVSGTVNSYILLQSDWEKLSHQVVKTNAENNIDLSDDDSSSSSSSSSSDDSSSKSSPSTSSSSSSSSESGVVPPVDSGITMTDSEIALASAMPISIGGSLRLEGIGAHLSSDGSAGST